jgi:hypothetical protein
VEEGSIIRFEYEEPFASLSVHTKVKIVDLRGRYSNRLDELKGLLGGTKTRVQESNP